MHLILMIETAPHLYSELRDHSAVEGRIYRVGSSLSPAADIFDRTVMVAAAIHPAGHREISGGQRNELSRADRTIEQYRAVITLAPYLNSGDIGLYPAYPDTGKTLAPLSAHTIIGSEAVSPCRESPLAFLYQIALSLTTHIFLRTGKR